MARVIVSALLFSLISFFAGFAGAAQIRILNEGGGSFTAELSGEIQPSDFAAMQRVIEPHLERNNVLRMIALNSPGGDLATAMRIGRYLRFLRFDTHVSKGARCISSCVFILASGLYRNALPNQVGIHRPYGVTTSSISKDEAEARFRNLTAKVYAYFDEMHIPQALPELMLSIPPENVRFLSDDELEKYTLIGKDPVQQELDDASNSKRLGLSRTEYLARRNHALKACDARSGDFVICYEGILREGK